MTKTEVTSTVALYVARFLLSAGNVDGGKAWLGTALARANQEGTDKGRIMAAMSYARRIQQQRSLRDMVLSLGGECEGY